MLYLHMLPKRKHQGADLTIFSEMSAFAQKHNAINLSQGFPDYEIDPKLKQLLAKATDNNHNQYAPLAGNPQLIENLIIFNKNRPIPIHIEKEQISITPGATDGIYCALTTILEPGDEVIIIEPCYDSYLPSIEMNGGIAVPVSVTENFEIDWEQLEKALSEKTKALIINTPNNPSGKILKAEEFEKIWQLIKHHEIYLISDEVYDLLTFDDHQFYSAFNHPELCNRTFSIFSFGKMCHITGWKIGYILACPELMNAYKRVHQYMSFCVNSPAQAALAEYLEIIDPKKNRKEMQARRDVLCDGLKNTRFEITEKAEGSYFQMASFKNIDENISDKDFAIWLTEMKKVATIPVASFYQNPHNTGMIRLCFAKKEETIENAIRNLTF